MLSNIKKMAIIAISVTIISGATDATTELPRRQEDATAPRKERDTVAYTSKNLTIFLLQSEDTIPRNYLTLEEAMEQKKIVLHETGNVGELSADNNSSDYIFIMAGDLVRGGKQDRTIGEDIVLAPGYKRAPIKSYCVEEDRWGPRGSEPLAYFTSSHHMLNNKALKVAVRIEQSQDRVREEIADFHSRMNNQMNEDVTNEISPTSLLLTLENEKIKDSIAEYVDALLTAFEDKNDVTGFAFFINGKISTVETFGNAALFRMMQRKLLEAAALEAFEKYDANIAFQEPTYTDLTFFLEKAENETQMSRKTYLDMIECNKKTEHSILLRSVNTDAGMTPLHTSIFATDDLSFGNIYYDFKS